MKEDEILIAVVIVMLIASTYMGHCVQRNLHHSKKAFEALTKEIGKMGLATINLDNEMIALERRVAELERH